MGGSSLPPPWRQHRPTLTGAGPQPPSSLGPQGCAGGSGTIASFTRDFPKEMAVPVHRVWGPDILFVLPDKCCIEAILVAAGVDCPDRSLSPW